jgi:hypothetical protein
MNGAVHTFAVFIGAEDTDSAVFAAEGFQTFESSLTVMEAGCGDRHCDVVIVEQSALAPLSIFPRIADVRSYGCVLETERCPVNVFSWFAFTAHDFDSKN